MRVLLNGLQAGNLSGTGRYTVELARRLPAYAPDPDCLILWPRHVPRPILRSGSDNAFYQVDIQRAVKRLFYDQIGLRRQRARFQADVVHFPANIGPLVPMRGVVLTIHDLSFLREPAWFRADRAAYYRVAVRRSARVAARIIADSEATAADVRELLDVPADRIDVVPLGVGEEFQPSAPEAQSAVRAWYRLPESFFLYVGTLEPRKNLVRLIQAWSRVAGFCPQDLVIAGRDGWKVEPIRAAAASSAFAHRIHFPGFIAHDDLPAVLSAAHAFVWPSLYEGFGLPPLEAMACHVPVITSNTSSLPETVGDAALLVDPTDVDQIGSALQRLAADDPLRDTLKAKGAARAAAFTWDATAHLTVQSYLAVGSRLETPDPKSQTLNPEP